MERIEIYIGNGTVDKEEKYAYLDEIDNLIAIGKKLSSKTSYFIDVIDRLMTEHGEDEINFVVFNGHFANKSYKKYDTSNYFLYPIMDSPTEFLENLEEIESIANDRINDSMPYRPIIVFIDNCAGFYKKQEEIWEVINRLIYNSDLSNIHFFISATNPDIVPMEVLSNIATKMSYYMPLKNHSYCMLGNDYALELHQDGEVIVKNDAIYGDMNVYLQQVYDDYNHKFADEYKGKWMIEIDDETIEFDSFYKAIRVLRNKIEQYFMSEINIFNYKEHQLIPFDVISMIHSRYDLKYLDDEDVVIIHRLNELLNCFLYSDIIEAQNGAISAIRNEYNYHKTNQYNCDLKVHIDKYNVDIKLDSDGEKTHLTTNAFVFNDPNKEYYFDSYQILNYVSNNNYDTYQEGDVVSLKIVLKPLK